MSVSAASSSRPVSPMRTSSQPRPGHAKPTDHDVRAMKDAFALARKGEQQGKGGAIEVKAKGEEKGGQFGDAGESADSAVDGLDQRQTVLRDDRDQDQGDAQGWAFGQALADAPVIVPNAPSPQVDAGAFAQLMSQLWAQARQKNEREIRVKFGTNAWPATGARIVRNAAGTLDIALQIDRGGGATDLDGLADQLTGSGIALGALTTEDGLA